MFVRLKTVLKVMTRTEKYEKLFLLLVKAFSSFCSILLLLRCGVLHHRKFTGTTDSICAAIESCIIINFLP